MPSQPVLSAEQAWQVAKVLCNALEMDDALLTDPDVQKYHRPHLGIPDRELFVKKGHIYVQKM